MLKKIGKKQILGLWTIIVVILVAYQWIFELPNDGQLVRSVFHFDKPEINSSYYYLIINILTILFPFLLSFDKKVAFYKRWKSLFKAISVVGLLFILWDILFTIHGVWGFNENYLTGITLFHLPLEECLFFLTVPYACIFIYDCLKSYRLPNPFNNNTDTIYIGLIFLLGILGILTFGKVYFSGTCLLTSAFLFYQFYHREAKTRSWILYAYLISWIPFMIVNGMLTGMISQEPIVMYHPEEILGIRILSVPLDDSIYSLLLIAMNLEIYIGNTTKA